MTQSWVGTENGMNWERVRVGGEYDHNIFYETVKKFRKGEWKVHSKSLYETSIILITQPGWCFLKTEKFPQWTYENSQ